MADFFKQNRLTATASAGVAMLCTVQDLSTAVLANLWTIQDRLTAFFARISRRHQFSRHEKTRFEGEYIEKKRSEKSLLNELFDFLQIDLRLPPRL